MALQASGTISFSQITNEFGTPPGKNLGAYRLDNQELNTNEGTVSYKEALGIETIPLDAGIPTSGEIKFSDFYGKRLNLIVDFYNHPTESIPTTSLTRDISFIVYRQGSGAAAAVATFTAQDGSGDTFTITNNSSNGQKIETRTVKKNVTYDVVFTMPTVTAQQGLIASSDALKSTASDTGKHSKGGRIFKLVSGTSKKAFFDSVGTSNDRDDMQITLPENINHIFTSGTGVRIRSSGPVADQSNIDGDTGSDNQRITRPITYILTENIDTIQVVLRKNIKTRYEENNPNTTIVVGGFKSKPTSGNVTGKVIAFANQTIGSKKTNRNNVALRTGSWGSNTQLITVIGSGGSLYGAGGDGGSGGGIPSAAGQGGQGSSAFGVQYPTTIINQGVIFGGRGGGGGGAGGWGWSFADVQDGCEGRRDQSLRIGGGGGAGGRGLPAGNGGPANTQSALAGGAGANFAGSGSSGTVDLDGSAGGGGSTSGGQGCNRHAFSGGGGAIESNGNGGNVSYGGEGSGGQRGYAIIIGSGGSIVSYSGNAASGITTNGTVS